MLFPIMIIMSLALNTITSAMDNKQAPIQSTKSAFTPVQHVTMSICPRLWIRHNQNIAQGFLLPHNKQLLIASQKSTLPICTMKKPATMCQHCKAEMACVFNLLLAKK
jgi:hypothetical protein